MRDCPSKSGSQPTKNYLDYIIILELILRFTQNEGLPLFFHTLVGEISSAVAFAMFIVWVSSLSDSAPRPSITGRSPILGFRFLNFSFKSLFITALIVNLLHNNTTV